MIYRKPSLGIIPKRFFEEERVQDLCGALYRRSHYNNSTSNYETMIKWAEELVERLYDLKFDKELEEELEE